MELVLSAVMILFNHLRTVKIKILEVIKVLEIIKVQEIIKVLETNKVLEMY